jgi:hypothetical protein
MLVISVPVQKVTQKNNDYKTQAWVGRMKVSNLTKSFSFECRNNDAPPVRRGADQAVAFRNDPII